MIFTSVLSILNFQNIFYYIWPILSPYLSKLTYIPYNNEPIDNLYLGIICLQLGIFFSILFLSNILKKLDIKITCQIFLFFTSILFYFFTRIHSLYFFFFCMIFFGISYHIFYLCILLFYKEKFGKNFIGSTSMYFSSILSQLIFSKISQIIINPKNIKNFKKIPIENINTFFLILSIISFLTIFSLFLINEPENKLDCVSHNLDADLLGLNSQELISKSISRSSISDINKLTKKESLLTSINELKDLGFRINQMIEEDDNISEISTEALKNGDLLRLSQKNFEQIENDVNSKESFFLLFVGIVKNCSCFYLFFNSKKIGVSLFENDELITNFVFGSIFFQFLGYFLVKKYWGKILPHFFYLISFCINLLSDLLFLYFKWNKYMFLCILVLNRLNMGISFKSDINIIFYNFSNKNIFSLSRIYHFKYFLAIFLGFILDLIRHKLNYNTIFGIFVVMESLGIYFIINFLKKKRFNN